MRDKSEGWPARLDTFSLRTCTPHELGIQSGAPFYPGLTQAYMHEKV